MTRVLGLDVGSNSIGSAWIDTESGEIQLGVSVFPAGIENSDTKRGAPLNLARRTARLQRRSLRRRAQRKRELREFLSANGLRPIRSSCNLFSIRTRGRCDATVCSAS